MDIPKICKIFLVQFLYSADTHLILSSFILSSLFIVLLSVGINHVFVFYYHVLNFSSPVWTKSSILALLCMSLLLSSLTPLVI